MTDIEKFRDEVLDHLREAKDKDLLAQASAGGLAMMFNKMAPSRAIHPHEWGGQTLEEKMPRLMEEKRRQEAERGGGAGGP